MDANMNGFYQKKRLPYSVSAERKQRKGVLAYVGGKTYRSWNPGRQYFNRRFRSLIIVKRKFKTYVLFLL